MRALIQRVSSASVTVDQQKIGEINKGIVVLLGITQADGDKEIEFLIEKILNCRIFPSDKSGFDFSVTDIKGGLLVVSQFTLYGNLKKGRRPDFVEAAAPEVAEKIYQRFVERIKEKATFLGVSVATGQFQAHMEVTLVNDGPVTLMIES